MLRIVAGRFRGRRLETPDTQRVRPTADRMKESMFNVLQSWVPEARVLDLFCGAGNLGIEALSRRAQSVVLVEKDRAALQCLQRNLSSLGLESSPAVAVVPGDAIRYLQEFRGDPFGIILADPPYTSAIEDSLMQSLQASHLAPEGVIVVQHRATWEPTTLPAWLTLWKSRSFGDTTITFLQRVEEKDG